MSPPPLPTPRLSVDPRTPPPPGDDFFAVTIVIEERVYFVPLREYASGQFAGEIGLRFPAPAATDAELELVQLWTRDDSPNFRPLATYRFRIGPLVDGTEVSSVVLDERRDGRRRPRDAPRLLRTGYELTVRTETQRDRALLVVEVAPLRRSVPTR